MDGEGAWDPSVDSHACHAESLFALCSSSTFTDSSHLSHKGEKLELGRQTCHPHRQILKLIISSSYVFFTLYTIQIMVQVRSYAVLYPLLLNKIIRLMQCFRIHIILELMCEILQPKGKIFNFTHPACGGRWGKKIIGIGKVMAVHGIAKFYLASVMFNFLK